MTPKEIMVNDGSLKAKQPKRMVLNPIKGIIIFFKICLESFIIDKQKSPSNARAFK